MPIRVIKVEYGALKRESGLSAVSLRPCGPLALIPINEKKRKSWGKIRTKNKLQRTPLGSPGDDAIK
jgi:hypothetical protein